MNRRLAFFDVDSRELNPSGDALSFRPRIEPLADRLQRLYAFAGMHGAPLVFTTCCSGRMLKPDSLSGILFVPLDPESKDWLGGVGSHRMFYVEKNAHGNASKNYVCRAFDVFATNGNAARLARSLSPDEWVVFGNGFDLCVSGVVHGLLDAGQRVCLLADVTCPSAPGYGPDGKSGTEENRRRILAELTALGVRVSSIEDVLSDCGS